jgi:putative heme-binding domain-containing protein
MGRIYRVRPKEKPPSNWKLNEFIARQGANYFMSENGWKRDMAAHIWLSSPTVKRRTIGPERAAVWSIHPECRVQALAVLAVGSGTFDYVNDRVKSALDDRHPAVRKGAVRQAEMFIMSDPDIGPAIAARATDVDSQVRVQAAYSLGYWDDPKAADALGRLAVKHADDPYLVAAVLSSVNEKNLSGVLNAVLKESGDGGPPPAVIENLVRMSVALNNDDATTNLLIAATTSKAGKYARWQFAAAAGAYLRPGAAGATVKVPSPLAERVQELEMAAIRVLCNPEAPEADRLAALPLVGHRDRPGFDPFEILRALLSPATSPTLRAATVRHLGQLDRSWAPGLLIVDWSNHPPATRNQVVDILMAHKDGPEVLLTGIETRKLPAGEVDAARRQRLLSHHDKAIRDRAAKAFGGATNPDRAKVLAAYADTPTTGDATRGKAVFTRVCGACHRLGDVGHHVGPDLAALANRTPAYLLQEILDPNRNLDSRYVEYQAATKAGRTINGMLAGETATTINLRGQERKEETLLRADIEELRGSGKSLMPEGLEKDLPKADMADLIAFVTAIRPPPKVIPGNSPTVVTQVGGRFTFRASEAEIYGSDITFESEFKNLGMWHGPNDRAEWRVSAPKTATFDVYLDFACDNASAGNELVIDGVNPPVKWKVPGTGTWANYRTEKIGIAHLAAGEGRIVVRPAGPVRGALIDLRTVYFVQPGKALEPDPKEPKEKDPTDPAAVAKLILDDTQPQARRNRLVNDNLHQAAAVIQALATGMPDQKEEYRRIPWIWRVAVAAGRKNEADKLRAILDVSLPKEKESLRHWQAVVIGGGVINGVSLAGAWPAGRLAELIGDDKLLIARWLVALEQSFPMADDEKVPTGTRYDALRMIALANWKAAEPALAKYLKKDAHAELQQGAISGLDDVEQPRAAELLVKGLADFTPGNRNLALSALMRTPSRARSLLDAVAAGQAKAEWLTPEHRKRLLENPDEGVRKRAGDVLKK